MTANEDTCPDRIQNQKIHALHSCILNYNPPHNPRDTNRNMVGRISLHKHRQIPVFRRRIRFHGIPAAHPLLHSHRHIMENKHRPHNRRKNTGHNMQPRDNIHDIPHHKKNTQRKSRHISRHHTKSDRLLHLLQHKNTHRHPLDTIHPHSSKRTPQQRPHKKKHNNRRNNDSTRSPDKIHITPPNNSNNTRHNNHHNKHPKKKWTGIRQNNNKNNNNQPGNIPNLIQHDPHALLHLHAPKIQ